MMPPGGAGMSRSPSTYSMPASITRLTLSGATPGSAISTASSLSVSIMSMGGSQHGPLPLDGLSPKNWRCMRSACCINSRASASMREPGLRVIAISVLLRCDRVAVRVAGQTVHELDSTGLYQLRRKIGMMFQMGGLFSDLTVFDNVAFPMRELTNLPESVIRDLVLMKLHAVGLRGACYLVPDELSGGMARRVALARAT